MKKVIIIFGTRPEAIKMCPVVQELKKRKEFETVVCVTGQHKEMLKQVLDVFDIQPDYDLNIMKRGQSLFDITDRVLMGIKSILEREKPDVALVHGDTSTAFAASLACFYKQIDVGHVEAGLRTHNIYSPFPEEFNRQGISLIAKYHFAPTELARENLLREGKKDSSIFVTGNTVIDALKTTVKSDYNNEVIDWVKGGRMILLTVHRRENLGESMTNIFKAVKRIVEENSDVKVVYPVHYNPEIREKADEILGGHPRIKLIEPLNVIDFHNFIAHAYLILTDSGGIQEEAPALGKPVLVLRDTTERTEGVRAGTLKLIGVDMENIYLETKELLDDFKAYRTMSRSVNPYGDGFASKRIGEILLK